MRIRILRLSLFFLFLVTSSCSGAIVHIKVTVINESGEPVNDAQVTYYYRGSASGERTYYGTTNRKGEDSQLGLAGAGVRYEVSKDGYYLTKGRLGYGNHDVSVTLREKINPIAMYAKKDRMFVDEELYGQWLGYDFFVGDFVSPYGVGVRSDLEVNIRFEYESPLNKRLDINIKFPNIGDGMVPFYSKALGGAYRSDYEAPVNGYQSEWALYEYREGVGVPANTNIDRNVNYYFRIRTQLNGEGEIEFAHYGKLYGDFYNLNFYTNPNPNDRNVEFDTRQNLIKDLEQEERVRAP